MNTVAARAWPRPPAASTLSPFCRYRRFSKSPSVARSRISFPKNCARFAGIIRSKADLLGFELGKKTEKGPEKMFCRAYINTNGMSNTPCWQDHDTCLQFYKPAVGLWIFHHWTELSCYQDKSWNLIATLHWYSFVLVCLHNQCWPRLPKGPYIKDIHKIFGFFDPLPPLSEFWLDL